MNEFSLASNRTISTTFLDLPIHVRQIQVKELDEITQAAQPVKTALDNDLNNIDVVLNGALVECLMLVSTLCQIPHDVLSKAFLEHYDDVKALVQLVLSVNQAYFIDTPDEVRKHKALKPDDSLTWFDTFQFLISQGHRHDDIMNMSYGAFKGYIKAAQRSYNNQLIANANTVRVAQHGDKKGFGKFIDGLKV